jgi:hypothetical protein
MHQDVLPTSISEPNRIKESMMAREFTWAGGRQIISYLLVILETLGWADEEKPNQIV